MTKVQKAATTKTRIISAVLTLHALFQCEGFPQQAPRHGCVRKYYTVLPAGGCKRKKKLLISTNKLPCHKSHVVPAQYSLVFLYLLLWAEEIKPTVLAGLEVGASSPVSGFSLSLSGMLPDKDD